MKIGSIYVRGKSFQAAIPYFEEAINLDPNYAPAYRELGQLYYSAGRLEQSKTNFKKYLELTEGNIPAKTRYVNSLFYAGDYDEVIKNVEEVMAVDKSRSYMNRLAGYSYYEKKNNPDYRKALGYMDELFKTVSPEWILPKDHHYTARILMKLNSNYNKTLEELETAEGLLAKEQTRYASASTAEKAKIKPTVDNLTLQVEKLKSDISNSTRELDRGFAEYIKLIEMKPNDRAVQSELATNYYAFKRYDRAAQVWASLIDPKNGKPEDYMQVGRAYYNGEKFKTADSVFNIAIEKSSGYIPAYLWIARTYSRMDPDSKLGLAKPKFEKLLKVAAPDSLKYDSELIEGMGYLGYYYMIKENYGTSKDYYNRMIALNPNNKENKIKGYNGIGLLELRMAGNEKTNEGRLPWLAKSADAYNKILTLDPNNSSAKKQIEYIREFEKQVRAGINPNEIKGVVTDAATGKPIPYASIRVKDTAAENNSNAQGAYKFEIPQSSEVLLVSAKGYQTKEVPVTKSRVYNVQLSK